MNDADVYAAVIDAVPQLEAQQAVDVALKAARWDFMMRVADNQDGPEAQALNACKEANEAMESDRPESVQLVEFVDAAIAQGGKA